MRRTSVRRRARAIGSAIVGIAALLSGCAYPGSVPPVDPTTRFSDQVRAVMPTGGTGGDRPWFCDVAVEGEAGGHGHHGSDATHYDGVARGPLAWEDCLAVAGFLDRAWASARRFPTRGDAQAAGGQQAVQFLRGTGTHDVIPGVSRAQFGAPDPAHPLYLQYDGDEPDAPLVGMSWFVLRGEPGPPPGLPGDNDLWHSHDSICYSAIGVAIGNEISEEECARRGGVVATWTAGWMLHAWIVPGYESRRDVFAESFGCVRGTGPDAPADDPCHGDFTHPEDRFQNEHPDAGDHHPPGHPEAPDAEHQAIAAALHDAAG